MNTTSSRALGYYGKPNTIPTITLTNRQQLFSKIANTTPHINFILIEEGPISLRTVLRYLPTQKRINRLSLHYF